MNEVLDDQRTTDATVDSRPIPVKGDQRFVKNINRMALLRMLRDAPGLSRADLADRSGLTRSTVSLITKDLIDEGWLIEDDAMVTGGVGRRPTPLRLDAERLTLLGAELGPDAIRVVTTSVQGKVLESVHAPLSSREPDAVCHQLVELITRLAKSMTRAGHTILGIGVGLPGAVDTTSGVLQMAPNIGWRNVQVGRVVGAKMAQVGLHHIRVYYQNEADLAAVGEAEFGDRPADDPLVYVSCEVGVGSGIILNDALFTGATGSAGEIGHTTLVIDGTRCACGRLGCAEAYVGLKTIATAAGCLDKQGIARDRLQAMIASGAPAAHEAFAQAGRHLGVLLQNVWTTFNPQTIVLGGETVTLGGNAFVQNAAEVLKRYAELAALPMPAIRTARYGELASAVGGAAFVLHALLRPYLKVPMAAANLAETARG
ncbi:MAG: ROK family protein [Burkholderiales bacterium]